MPHTKGVIIGLGEDNRIRVHGFLKASRARGIHVTHSYPGKRGSLKILKILH